jgi:hypothetical protein
MRVKLVIALVAVTTAIVAPAGSAAAGPPFVNHFKGRGAQAILTDCTLALPDGTECAAVDIFVSIDNYRERGSSYPLSYVNVLVYEVLIDSTAPLGFIPTPVASGFSTDAEVSVARNLSSASVSATQIGLALCEVDIGGVLVCEGDGGTMSLDVSWAATDGRVTTTFHELGADFPMSYNLRSVDASRAATATGEVNGETLHETPLFPSSIFMANNGVVDYPRG